MTSAKHWSNAGWRRDGRKPFVWVPVVCVCAWCVCLSGVCVCLWNPFAPRGRCGYSLVKLPLRLWSGQTLFKLPVRLWSGQTLVKLPLRLWPGQTLVKHWSNTGQMPVRSCLSARRRLCALTRTCVWVCWEGAGCV